MGILRTFERIGTGLISMIFKFILVLILVAVILLFIIGIASHWELVLGILIGALFSSTFYTFIENNLELGLPEYFYWNVGDLADAFFDDEFQADQVMKEAADKKKAAMSELNDLDQKYMKLEATFESIKTKGDIGQLSKDKKQPSSRVKKAIMMEIGDPEWVSELKDIKPNVNWDKYQI